MNKNFEWSRFCKVVKKDFYNIWPSMGSTMMILVLLPTAIWVLGLLFGLMAGSNPVTSPTFRIVFASIMITLVGFMAPSRLYGNCNLGKEGIYFAMLPASKLEKYLSMLLHCLIVCPLMAMVGLFVMDTFLTLLPFGPYHTWIWNGGNPFDLFRMNEFTVQDESFVMNFSGVMGGFIFAQVVSDLFSNLAFVFTNTIFKKHKVSKTILWYLLISFALSIVLMPIFVHVFAHKGESFALWMATGNHMALVIWIGNAISLLFCGVLVWWTGRRLKKMAY